MLVKGNCIWPYLSTHICGFPNFSITEITQISKSSQLSPGLRNEMLSFLAVFSCSQKILQRSFWVIKDSFQNLENLAEGVGRESLYFEIPGEASVYTVIHL